MYGNFNISTAQDLVKGLAVAVRDGKVTMDEVNSFILECTDGDERLTQVVLEKVGIQLECMNLSVWAHVAA